MVAVSVSAQLELLGTVRAWFDMWLWLLEEENPALVALFDSSRGPNIVSIHDYLNRVARRAGIEFFVAHRAGLFFAGCSANRRGNLAQICRASGALLFKDDGFCAFHSGEQIATAF